MPGKLEPWKVPGRRRWSSPRSVPQWPGGDEPAGDGEADRAAAGPADRVGVAADDVDEGPRGLGGRLERHRGRRHPAALDEPARGGLAAGAHRHDDRVGRDVDVPARHGRGGLGGGRVERGLPLLEVGERVVDDDGLRTGRLHGRGGTSVGDADVQHVLRGVDPGAGVRGTQSRLEDALLPGGVRLEREPLGGSGRAEPEVALERLLDRGVDLLLDAELLRARGSGSDGAAVDPTASGPARSAPAAQAVTAALQVCRVMSVVPPSSHRPVGRQSH